MNGCEGNASPRRASLSVRKDRSGSGEGGKGEHQAQATALPLLAVATALTAAGPLLPDSVICLASGLHRVIKMPSNAGRLFQPQLGL